MAKPVARPDLPKGLAARIRAAQEKVRKARQSIIWGGKAITRSEARIQDYEGDPQGFADRFYRGKDWDSYPVQETMRVERERLAYNVGRVPARLVELAEAEAHLGQVEEAALIRVAAMRPSSGRVSWPKRLPSFEAMQHEADLEEAREAARAKARKEADDAYWAREMEIADRKAKESIGNLVDAVNSWIDGLEPKRAAAVRATIRENVERVRNGEMTPVQFMATFAMR